MKILDTIKTKLNITDKDIEDTTSFVKSVSKNTAIAAKQQMSRGYDLVHDKTVEAVEEYKKANAPIDNNNSYRRASMACESVSDAILHENSGTSTKIAKGTVGKLGAVGTSVGVFSIASILGTASTGTAIGSLSGAAFTSASLAWIGGSVMMGSIIVGIASIAGGIGAVLGAGWVFKKYVYGEKRKRSDLELKEQNIIDVCLSLSIAFREQEQSGISMNPIVANALYTDVLKPLTDDLLEYRSKTENWQFMAKKRFNDATDKLIEVTYYLKNVAKQNPNISTGVVSSVVMQLFSDDISSWSANEELVIEALRRSKNDLNNASYNELSEYVKELEPVQIKGLQNNIKGIYHELRFARDMNEDSDEYIVELFEATNHPGADIRIINTVTGDVKEVQLKATEYLSYIKKHNERYEDIEVFATTEVAALDGSIESTNISIEDINSDTSGVIDALSNNSSPVTSSIAVAAMVTLAKNAKALLRKEEMSQKEKEHLTKDGLVAAGVAGLTSLIIG